MMPWNIKVTYHDGEQEFVRVGTSCERLEVRSKSAAEEIADGFEMSGDFALVTVVKSKPKGGAS